MKRIAIAMLSVGVLACAGAQAQTRIYGLLDGFVSYADVKSNDPAVAGGGAARVDTGGMSTSYWGLGGKEDLGNGLKAIWAFEGFFRFDTGESGRFTGDGIATRDAYVGFEGNFGRSTLGRNTTPYFVSTVVYNPFGDSFVFSPAVAHTYRNNYVLNDSGWSNSLLYATPTIQGLGANLIYSLGQEEQRFEDPPNSWGGSLNWSKGALGLNAAYQKARVGAVGSVTEQDALLLSGAYDFEVVKLYAQYQRLQNSRSGAEDEDDMFQLGASVPLGRGTAMLSWAGSKTRDNDAATADVRRDSWAVGYRYDFSRRTDGYVAFYQSKRDQGGVWARQQVAGIGMRYRY
jgi:predicted porin